MKTVTNFPYEPLIAVTPHWPKEGVFFRDISPLLATRFAETIDAMAALFTADELAATDAFVGVDARGFIFAAALAQKCGKNLVIVRKGGKLPPPSHQESYALEYGHATIELKPAHSHLGEEALKPAAPRVIVVDDVLATGGTFKAAADLCTRAGYQVTALAALIDLKFLNDFSWNGQRVRSVIRYEG